MATGNAKRFQAIGVPGAIARELAAQITASTGNFERLRELGFPARASRIVAASVVSHTVSVASLTQAGVVPEFVKEFAAQIAT
jgi:hypothetical protein